MDCLTLIIKDGDCIYVKTGDPQSFLEIPVANVKVETIKETVAQHLGRNTQILGFTSVRVSESALNDKRRIHCHLVVECPADTHTENLTGFKWSTCETIKGSLADGLFSIEDSHALGNMVKGQISPFSQLGFQQYTAVELFTLPNSTYYSAQQQQLFKSASFQSSDLALLHKVFTDYAWPKTYMTEETLTKLLSDFDFRDTRYSQYYRAFAKDGQISFKEFAVAFAALVAMDTKTEHGPLCGLSRSQFIFRFYAEGQIMTEDNYRGLINDLIKVKAVNQSNLDKEINNYLRIFGYPTEPINISQDAFITSIGEMKLRGTSALFRDGYGLLNQLKKKWIKPDEDITMRNSSASTTTTESTESQTNSHLELQFNKLKVECFNNGVMVSSNNGMVDENNQLSSSDIDNSKRVAMGIHCFLNSRMSWKKVDCDTEAFSNSVVQMCMAVQRILIEEEKVVEIVGGCNVVGAINGDLERLVKFSTVMWPLGIEAAPFSTCFLADYCGSEKDFGLEVLIYLFAMKLISAHRKNLVLLRGCQETPDGLTVAGLQRRCTEVFGANGDVVYIALQDCLDCLPFIAIINEKIACVHHGFPVSEFGYGSMFEYLRKLSKQKVSNPEQRELLSYILWYREVGFSVRQCQTASKESPVKMRPEHLRNFLRWNHFVALITSHPFGANLEPELISLPPLNEDKFVCHIASVEKTQVTVLEVVNKPPATA